MHKFYTCAANTVTFDNTGTLTASLTITNAMVILIHLFGVGVNYTNPRCHLEVAGIVYINNGSPYATPKTNAV
jgi:uncharacterized membrane protein